MIDLGPASLVIVERILAEHVPECEVRAFGSRATWTAKDHSDLDLAIVGEGRLPRGTLARLKESFEESTLPMRVDVLDWHNISESFRKVIKRHYAVVREGAPPGRQQTVALGDVIRVNPSRPLARGVEAPFASMADLLEHHRLLPRLDTREFKGGGARFRNGDTLLARITPSLENGKTALVSGLAADAIGHGSTEFIVLSAREGVTDSHFVYYLARSPDFRNYAIGQMTGTSGRQRVPTDAVEQFELPLPPLDEQRAIARILGALDDKIELNRRMSATLEAMARALFKSWFVDFEPVRAKAEGRSSGLPPALDALFPASFEASELGEIPSGWGVGTLGDVAGSVRGRSYRSAELAESDTALVTLKSFARGGGYRAEGLKPYTGKYKPAQIVGPGELIIACTDVTQAAEVIGRPAIVPADQRFTTLVASLDTLIIRPRDISVAPVPFLYCLTSEPSFTQHTYARVSGTTVLHLSKEAVPAFKFPLPPSDLIRAFVGLAGPAFKRMTDLSVESAATAAQRDALLPRLVSGEVRVGAK